MVLKKIISGGQTGADTAGLDAARYLGIETGGTVPKGWRICLPNGSDGSNPNLADYGLVEHTSREYPPRTIQNVKDSDGTVWFEHPYSAGGKLTLRTCRDNKKPYLVNPSPLMLRHWIKEHSIECLNVAGNRDSTQNPTVYQDTYRCIVSALAVEV